VKIWPKPRSDTHCRPALTSDVAKAIVHASVLGLRSPSGREVRFDGWTPFRIRGFLYALAAGGSVEVAARAAGMSRRSAYNLRNRAEGLAFRLAWDAAQGLGRRPLSDTLMSRAMHGVVEPIIRNGKIWGERHRFDNRLGMAMLTRLDRHARELRLAGLEVDLAAESFDDIVETACVEGVKYKPGDKKPTPNGNRVSCELNRGKNPPRDGEGAHAKRGGGAAPRSVEPNSQSRKSNTRFPAIDENDKAPTSSPGLTPHIPASHHRAYT
jgi:hypothetical protein